MVAKIFEGVAKRQQFFIALEASVNETINHVIKIEEIG